jgi:predicted RNA-binding Zn ribbon-like protein
VDLASYADLAVRLANTGTGRRSDELATPEGYRTLVGDTPFLNGRVTSADLEALRLLRAEFRLIFTGAASGDDAAAVDRLNALLARHPIHPQLVRHDGQHWHVHLTESGSTADKYAAGAIAGLVHVVNDSGTSRLGVCAADDCGRAFIGVTPVRKHPYCSEKCSPQASVRALRVQHGRRGRTSTAAS